MELAMRFNIVVLTGVVLVSFQAVRAQGTVLSLAPEDRQMIESRLGPGVIGEALESSRIDDISAYFPLQEVSSSYQVVSGRTAGSTQVLALTKVKRPNGRIVWRLQLSPTLSTFIRPTANDDLIMPAVSDPGEGVVVIMTPATPLLLKGMKPGESRVYVQRVTVEKLDDPSDKEYSGTLRGSYTYLGTYRVRVPAGVYDAALFRLKWRGKVGPAETHDTAYYFFAPGKGLVAIIRQENATAFWLIHIDTSSGKVLKP